MFWEADSLVKSALMFIYRELNTFKLTFEFTKSMGPYFGLYNINFE